MRYFLAIMFLFIIFHDQLNQTAVFSVVSDMGYAIVITLRPQDAILFLDLGGNRSVKEIPIKIVCFSPMALIQRTLLKKVTILLVAVVVLKTVALREHHWVVAIALVSV